MDDERRRILEMVAQGSVTPEEASELLDSLKRGSEGGDQEEPEPAKTTTSEDVKAVKVVGSFRALRIEGDRSVKGVTAEGPHRARNENGTMIFEDDLESDEEPSYVLFGPREITGPRRISINVNAKGKTWTFNRNLPSALKIRMNPELPLEIELTAGSLRVSDIEGPVIASMTAGSGKFERMHSPLHLSVEAGSVDVSGTFDSGDSEIRCTTGKVRCTLLKGSDVTVRGRSTLGKMELLGRQLSGIGTTELEQKVGDGTARLDIDVTTGKLQVMEG